MFVRFQSVAPNRHGRFPGVFAMANGLDHDQRLDARDTARLREMNARATAAYADPSTVVPDCYDPVRHPGARSWFKADATTLLTMTREYLDLLDRYDIFWAELRTAHPGAVVYEDDVQVVALPASYPDDWPFPPAR